MKKILAISMFFFFLTVSSFAGDNAIPENPETYHKNRADIDKMILLDKSYKKDSEDREPASARKNSYDLESPDYPSFMGF